MSNKIKEEALWKPDIPIPAGDKFFLNEIITNNLYEKWFARTKPAKIFVLNKERCGNGEQQDSSTMRRECSRGYTSLSLIEVS